MRSRRNEGKYLLEEMTVHIFQVATHFGEDAHVEPVVSLSESVLSLQEVS